MTTASLNLDSTINGRLLKWFRSEPEAIAQFRRKEGTWEPITVEGYVRSVGAFERFLASSGVNQGDRVVIFSYNSPEWAYCELGSSLRGALSLGLYPNSSDADICHAIRVMKPKVIVVQNRKYFDRVQSACRSHSGSDEDLLGAVNTFVDFSGELNGERTVSILDAMDSGKREFSIEQYENRLKELDPKKPSFVILTSGTTGKPKAAMLSQDNLVFAADSVTEAWRLPSALSTKEVVSKWVKSLAGKEVSKSGRPSLFSFLPLSHIAEKLQSIAVGISNRYSVYYCTDIKRVTEELRTVQPSMLLCVPRFWEKMVEGVEKKLSKAPRSKQKLFERASSLSARAFLSEQGNELFGTTDWIQLKALDTTVLGPIREALGLVRKPVSASGAARLPEHVAKWFLGLGIEILEDYGQTESTGILAMTVPSNDCTGTVGKPAPGTELRIADDGEILTKGRHVFVGYYNQDDESRKTIDEDGWLHTGDLGQIDSRGYLKIVGRKKEILKSSGGKMISPAPIEARIEESPLISQVCIVGDNQKYFTALVTLSEVGQAKVNGNTEGGIVQDEVILSQLKETFDHVNQPLASYEKIKYFRAIKEEFSIEKGELTPTMKLKRHVIQKNYAGLISEMY